jgi:hypothetical protein
LIAKLAASAMVMSRADAQTEIRRQAETKARVEAAIAEDRARKQAKDLQWSQAAEHLREAHAVQGWLHEKLFTLDRQQLKPMEDKSIASTRVFGFYFTAMNSAPCRAFTPQLVEAYQRLKKLYGDDFEFISISRDRDEFNQLEFMKTFHVPWPTMKFGPVDAKLAPFGGDRVPWFVIVSDTGKPLSINAVDGRYVEPELMLAGLEQFLQSSGR